MRYNDKQKADVIAFVKKHNEKHGRGGQSAAKEKFGISPISIASWLTKAGEELPGKGGRKKSGKAASKAPVAARKGKPGRPKGSKNTSKKGKPGRAKAKKSAVKSESAAGSGTEKKLQRLSQILAEIASLQQEFDSLKKTL